MPYHLFETSCSRCYSKTTEKGFLTYGFGVMNDNSETGVIDQYLLFPLIV